MTNEECQEALRTVRREQGTRCPVVRVDAGGKVFRGRLLRADSDPEHRPHGAGLLELATHGARGPKSVVRIAEIPAGGIRGEGG